MVPHKLSGKRRRWWKICISQVIATKDSTATMGVGEKPADHLASRDQEAAAEAADGSSGKCLTGASLQVGNILAGRRDQRAFRRHAVTCPKLTQFSEQGSLRARELHGQQPNNRRFY